MVPAIGSLFTWGRSMRVGKELEQFVYEAHRQRLGVEAIAEALEAAGWPEDQIRSALGQFADVDFPVPVPKPKARIGAKEAFTYLVMFVSLYVVAFGVVSLAFNAVNLIIDPPDNTTNIEGNIRWMVASLIVFAPVYLAVSVLIGKSHEAEPLKRRSKVRHWLTYASLFLAAVLILWDITGLIYSFLAGELTLKIVLKSGIFLSVLGGLFIHYFRDIRQDSQYE